MYGFLFILWFLCRFSFFMVCGVVCYLTSWFNLFASYFYASFLQLGFDKFKLKCTKYKQAMGKVLKKCSKHLKEGSMDTYNEY